MLVPTSIVSFFLLIALIPCITNASPDRFLNDVHNLRGTTEWNGTIWALLVAGSNSWFNYRHQADICHSFQVLREHGIPEENIVVMMYDDIAYNEENPTPGVVINHPGGSNVYTGVPKDYVNDTVNPEMFLRVLQGDAHLASAGHKVIASGPEDHVFVYFADHGAPGLIAFPNDVLTATQLMKALKSMAKNRAFAKMVLYIEACESGSMFENLLPPNINIYATTAANSTESSYAVYYDDERDTYLGDVYSVNWIEDSDRRPSLAHETLQKQFVLVQKETNTSHVEEFGDLNIGQLHVSQFQGSKRSTEPQANCRLPPMTDAIPSPEVPFSIAAKKLAKSRNNRERAVRRNVYNALVEGRRYLQDQMENIAKQLQSQINAAFDELWTVKRSITKHDCYEDLIGAFNDHCFDLTDHPYALRYLYIFVNFCEKVDHDQSGAGALINSAKNDVINHCNNHVSGHHSYRSIM